MNLQSFEFATNEFTEMNLQTKTNEFGRFKRNQRSEVDTVK